MDKFPDGLVELAPQLGQDHPLVQGDASLLALVHVPEDGVDPLLLRAGLRRAFLLVELIALHFIQALPELLQRDHAVAINPVDFFEGLLNVVITGDEILQQVNDVLGRLHQASPPLHVLRGQRLDMVVKTELRCELFTAFELPIFRRAHIFRPEDAVLGDALLGRPAARHAGGHRVLRAVGPRVAIVVQIVGELLLRGELHEHHGTEPLIIPG
mmetsp:Transcript_81449/g.248857  ORF Transcript_81449/g.248857 Transcript_81449/m.248857 type:complete len:213 (-) Transcript_81449:1098-1736(-)